MLGAEITNPGLESLRTQACELSCEALSILGRLQRELSVPLVIVQRETPAQWTARQTAPSGISHTRMPDGRGEKSREASGWGGDRTEERGTGAAA